MRVCGCCRIVETSERRRGRGALLQSGRGRLGDAIVIIGMRKRVRVKVKVCLPLSSGKKEQGRHCRLLLSG